MADTLKIQHISGYTKGNVLYSDMGRILFSITEDSVGFHDAIGGLTNPTMASAKYDNTSYQEHKNDYARDGYSCFISELSKYGMTRESLISNINFFSKISIDEKGDMNFIKDHSKAGDFVELRAEMDTLVLLNTCPHPLCPNAQYQPKEILLELKTCAAAGEKDPCRLSCEENVRGFINTENWNR